MNDLRNLQTAVSAANKEKGHAQVALSYTLGDAYTLDYWTTMAKRIEEMGADSICIKDMAGASAAKSPPIHDLFVYITIFFLRRMFFLNLLTDA